MPIAANFAMPQVFACDQAGATGSTYSGAVMPRQFDALRSHLIEVWGFDAFAAKTAQIGVTQIVGQDVDDVRLGGPLSMLHLFLEQAEQAE